MNRKPRSDSKLLNLPPSQQDALAAWLLEEGISYAEAVSRLKDRFTVKTSEGSLSHFFAAVCAPRRLRRAAEAAKDLSLSFGGSSGSRSQSQSFEASSDALLQQKYFEVLASPSADPKEILALGNLAAELKRIDLARSDSSRKLLELEERKEARKIKQAAHDLAVQKFEDLKSRTAQARDILEAAKNRGGLSTKALADMEAAMKLL